jgi:hypothetical protein
MSSGTAASAAQSMAAMNDCGPWSSHTGHSAQSGRPGLAAQDGSHLGTRTRVAERSCWPQQPQPLGCDVARQVTGGDLAYQRVVSSHLAILPTVPAPRALTRSAASHLRQRGHELSNSHAANNRGSPGRRMITRDRHGGKGSPMPTTKAISRRCRPLSLGAASSRTMSTAWLALG